MVMDEKKEKALDKVLEALSFYANAAIYWGKPIPLDSNLDQRTLHIKHEATQASEIMQDGGEIARQALFEFEGVFDCTYEVRSEF